MKALKRDLQSVVKSLKALTQRTEKIAKKLNKLEKAMAAKKPRAKARVKAKPAKERVTRKVTVKKRTKITAIDAVLGVIKRSRKGVTTAQIKEKTGFNEKKIWDIVNRAKRQGKVKSVGRGVYVKV
jgi:hypothetical protein